MNKDKFLTRKRQALLLVALLLTAILLTTAIVQAVHDKGLFELDVRAGVDGDQEKPGDPIPSWVGDGNTVDDPGVGDDWENILADYEDGTPAGDNSGAFAISIVGDTFANGNVNGAAEPSPIRGWVPTHPDRDRFSN